PQVESVTSDDFAPALPPELLEARRLAREKNQATSSSDSPRRVLGPMRPPNASSDPRSGGYGNSDSESDDDDVIGPSLPSNVDKEALSRQSKIQEFEERAERMRRKLAGVIQ